MSFERAITSGTPLEGEQGLQQARAWSSLGAFLVAVAAVLEQARIGLDTDVSWLLTVGERVLGGARLYSDIVEVNPPASVLIYLPGIAAAHALGLKVELVTAALLFLLAAASCLLAGRLLSDAGILRPAMRGPMALWAAFAVLLLPGLCFAQREHIALLTLLPLIAVVGVRIAMRPVSLRTALLAGCGAGVTMAIKPHFVLAVAPMLLLAAWRRRSLRRLLQAETGCAFAVVLAYLAGVAAFYPGYFTQVLPLVSAVYLPVRIDAVLLWSSPAALLYLLSCVTVLIIGRRELAHSFAVLPLLASLGFAAAMSIQGKGYLNHFYPAVALAMLSLCWLVAERRGNGEQALLGTVACVLLAGTSLVFFDLGIATPYVRTSQLVRQVAPPHPRIIVAASNLAIGHPLTRWVGGQWVGTRGSLWATGTARDLLGKTQDPAKRKYLRMGISEDRRLWVADVLRERPDVILADEEGLKWIERNPDVRSAMAPYRAAGAADGITVMTR